MDGKKIMKYIVLVAVVLIPIMYSFFYLKAYWNPYGNLQDIKIAMVNLDNGKEGENQGRKLVDSMKENGTFNISAVTADEAEEGLINGEYYAVIKIPSTFTEDLNSAQEENKQITTITYSPNQKSNYLASQIINSAIKKIELNLNSQVAEKVTETLTDKLNDVPDSLQEIADGADQINDGAKALNDGATQLSNGTGELNNSYAEFDAGVNAAYSGSTQLDEGITSLADGASSLVDGADNLLSGTASLDKGISTLKDGTSTLNSGATEVNNGAQKLKSGTSELSAGASSVSAGASEIEGYLAQLYDGIKKTKAGYTSIDTGINEAATSIEKIKTAMNQLGSQASDLQKLKTSNEKAISTLQASNKEIEKNYNTYFASLLGNKSLSKVTDAEITTVANTIATRYATGLGAEKASQIGKTYAALLTTWRDTYVGNMQLLELSQGNLKAVKTILGLLASEDLKTLTSDETKKKLESLKTGSKTMDATLGSLEKNIEKIYNGSKNLSAGAAKVSTGASTVASGANSLAKGTDKLQSGAVALVDGASTLKTGSTQLENGTKQLKEGTEVLSAGIGTLKQGSTNLNTGLEVLAESSKRVKQGVSSLDAGAKELASGTNTLRDGTLTFTSEINSGLEDTKHELTKLNGLSKFVSSPVEIEEKDYGKVEEYGLSFTPLFLSIGLWVGALMSYVVLYYDQDRRFRLLGRHADNGFLQILLYFGIAIMQGIITGLLLKVGLGFTVTNALLYYFTCVFVSIVFMSIIQFLIMNFGDIGKFLALVILVLQLAASGGTFPVETVAKGFQGINPILPMTYSIRLVKEAVVMQDKGFAPKNIGMLFMYLIVTLGITLIIQFIKKKKSGEDEKQKAGQN